MKRNRLGRMVSLIPVKLFKGENETLMEKVEAGKRQRLDEVRVLSVKRLVCALEDDADKVNLYGKLEEVIRKDFAERVKTPFQRQKEELARQDDEKRREANERNLQARKLWTPPQFGAIGIAFGNAEEALTFANSFK